MKILFLSRWFPWPADNGARIRIYNLLRSLSERHEIYLVSFCDSPPTRQALDHLRAFCREIRTVRHKPFLPGTGKALAGLFSLTPRSLVDMFSPELQAAAQQIASASGPMDMLISSQIDMVPYLENIHARYKVIEELEVGILRQRLQDAGNPFSKLRHWLTWIKLTGYVRRMSGQVDGITVVSEREKSLAGRMVKAGVPLRVVANGVDSAALLPALTSKQRKPMRLIYNGSMTYAPNFEAMRWFVRDVFPRVRETWPETELVITGEAQQEALHFLSGIEGVLLSGYVDDIADELARASVAVISLQSGGGTRLKVLEAMAAGVPVVSTSKGVEGLDLQPGEDFLLADSADQFAAAVTQLLGDQNRQDFLREHAARTVRSRYDWSLIGKELTGFLDEINSGKKD